MLLSRHQIGIETQMRGSGLIFDCVNLFYYKCHKIDFKPGGSYIVSSDWIKNKKAKINPKNDDDRCFQYSGTIASVFDEIKKDAQRVSNMKPFINNYNWEGISYPLKTDYWERFEKIIWQLLLMFCILK